MGEKITAETTVYKLINRLHLADDLPLENSGEEQFKSFAKYIECLINNDFNKLVNILYRVDVSEHKVRKTLAVNEDKSAGELIAVLILEREAEKIAWRTKYSQK